MHAESLALMDQALSFVQEENPGRRMNVLDVGSYDVNGSYRPLVESRGWDYFGVDLRHGPNVDGIVFDERLLGVPFQHFSVVMCGNMLHNVRYPWVLVRAMANALSWGGTLIVIAPGTLPAGSLYPKDYWRFLPDGILALFEATNMLRECVAWMDTRDVVGKAKRGNPQ